MAIKKTYEDALSSQDGVKVEFKLKGDIYFDGLFFDGIYFDSVPEGKSDYYARHSENNWDVPISVRKHKGLMVNFCGTLVLDESLDKFFEKHNTDEIKITRFYFL